MPELDPESREERDRRQRKINELLLHKAKMSWPVDRIAQQDKRIAELNTWQYEKEKFISAKLGNVNEARIMLHDLMVMTNNYSNFKKKVNMKDMEKTALIRENRELKLMQGSLTGDPT